MLEPKIYSSNGLEACRLLGADGSEFFYEGRVDYNPDQVFKDSQGRAYYLVTTDLGKGMIYYVEVEPQRHADTDHEKRQFTGKGDIGPRGLVST